MKRYSAAAVESERKRRARVRRNDRLAKKAMYAEMGVWCAVVYYEAWDIAALVGSSVDWRQYWLTAVRIVLEEYPEATLSSGMRSMGGWKGVNEKYPHLFREPADVYEIDDWDTAGRTRNINVDPAEIRRARVKWGEEYALKSRTKPKDEGSGGTSEG